jgi:zinc transport system ATP-binding protein
VLQGQVILEGISFDLQKGTTLSLVGPNGAGKSILFRALLNLIPHTGRVEWAKNVKVGYVPQMVSVRDVPISVREFLTMRRGTTPEAALDLVGLDEHILKKGLSVLSGGQLRRVLIAWAVMDRPDMLLFDEPTTGVDLDSEEAIYDMLKGLTRNAGITTILISHERHIVRDYSEKMLAIDGCVKFYGDSKMIMDPEVQWLIYTERHACRPIVPLGEADG